MPPTVPPTVPPCVARKLSLPAAADAWLEQNSPTSNKGSDTTLKVKSQRTTDNFRLLVRFDVLSVVPTGCEVTSATLQMFSTSATPGRQLQAWSLTSPWVERTVTWANQPSTAGIPATTSSGLGARGWNVTNQVDAAVRTGAHYGFQVRDAIESSEGFEQSFAARELSQRPVLILSVVPRSSF
jgi:hypothetical protein